MKIQHLFEEISGDLSKVEAGLRQFALSQEKTLTGIGTHLLRAGGKRLRPALFLLSAKTQVYDPERLVPVAVALELIHTASLVHDDVIDEAATRRGRETASAKWGNMVSVLAGDFLFAQAFAAISHIADRRIIAALSQLVSNMCEGEITQFLNIFNPAQTEEEYLLRIQKKTADFLACACDLGSYMADAGEAVIDGLKEYGYCVGMAFQITDDILDVTGDDGELGKPVGNDLRQGIITLPAIYTLRHSPARDELRLMLGRRSLTPGEVSRGLEIIRAAGAVEYAAGLAGQYIRRAKEMINVVQDRALREKFSLIADYVGQRSY